MGGELKSTQRLKVTDGNLVFVMLGLLSCDRAYAVVQSHTFIPFCSATNVQVNMPLKWKQLFTRYVWQNNSIT